MAGDLPVIVEPDSVQAPDWIADLTPVVNGWIADSDLANLLNREFQEADPTSWHWVDVYPRWLEGPPSDPRTMLQDWRAQEWQRIEFLYLHLPYCVQRCHFCYYFISTDISRSQEYLTALRDEVRVFLGTLPRHASAGDLFFGGGTPSMMAVPDLQRLYDTVYEHVDQSNIGMVTLEVHPRTMRKDMHRLAESGHIRRVSMGVQSFSKPVLDTNGRIWVEPDRIRKICARFRESGIEHIGLDFMVGLHTQSAADVLDDVAHIAELARDGMIDSVSVYPRSFTEIWGTFSGESINAETLLEKYRCHLLYRAFFEALGWREGPLYLFTAPTFAANTPSALVHADQTAQALAFGNSARSTFSGTNYLNIRSPDQYLETIGEHSGATTEYRRFTRGDANRRHLHFGIKRGVVDEKELPHPPSQEEQAQLDAVAEDLTRRRLIERSGTRIELTRVGQLLIELVHRGYEQTFPEPAEVVR